MDHLIYLSLVRGDDGRERARATPNPLQQSVHPGDTVTWRCVDTAAGRNLHLEFRMFFASGSPTAGITNTNPFAGLGLHGEDQFSEPVRPETLAGLYTYHIFEGDTELQWAEPFPNPPNQKDRFFGGIVIEDPPGRSPSPGE